MRGFFNIIFILLIIFLIWVIWVNKTGATQELEPTINNELIYDYENRLIEI